MSSQGYGCSPFKVVRELGSDRTEVIKLKVVPAGRQEVIKFDDDDDVLYNLMTFKLLTVVQSESEVMTFCGGPL